MVPWMALYGWLRVLIHMLEAWEVNLSPSINELFLKSSNTGWQSSSQVVEYLPA
jgi:hypothetical protein